MNTAIANLPKSVLSFIFALVNVARGMFFTAAKIALAPEGYAEVKKLVAKVGDIPFYFFAERALEDVALDVHMGLLNLRELEADPEKLQKAITHYLAEPISMYFGSEELLRDNVAYDLEERVDDFVKGKLFFSSPILLPLLPILSDLEITVMEQEEEG